MSKFLKFIIGLFNTPENAASILKGEPTRLIKAGQWVATFFTSSQTHTPSLSFASNPEEIAEKIAQLALNKIGESITNTNASKEEGGASEHSELASGLLSTITSAKYLNDLYKKYHGSNAPGGTFDHYHRLATPAGITHSQLITLAAQLISDLNLKQGDTQKMCTCLSQFSGDLDAKLALGNGSTQLMLECLPLLVEQLKHSDHPGVLINLVYQLSLTSPRARSYQPISQTATIAEAVILFAALNPKIVKAFSDHILKSKLFRTVAGPHVLEGASVLAQEIVENGDLSILCQILDTVDAEIAPETQTQVAALATQMQPNTLKRFIDCACNLPFIGPKIISSGLVQHVTSIHTQLRPHAGALHANPEVPTEIISNVQDIINAVNQLAKDKDVEGFLAAFSPALTQLFALNRNHREGIKAAIEVARSISKGLGSNDPIPGYLNTYVPAYLNSLSTLFSLVGEDEGNDQRIIRRLIDVTNYALNTPVDTNHPDFSGCIAKTAIGALCIVDSVKKPDNPQDLTHIYELFKLIMPTSAVDALGVIKLILDPGQTLGAFNQRKLVALPSEDINKLGEFVSNLCQAIQKFPVITSSTATPHAVAQTAIENMFDSINMLDGVPHDILSHILTTSQAAIVDSPAIPQKQWLGLMARSIPLAKFARTLHGKAGDITDLMVGSACGDDVINVGLRSFVFAKSLPPEFFTNPEALEALVALAASDINTNKDVKINARALQAAITKLGTADRSGFTAVAQLIGYMDAETPTQLLKMWVQYSDNDWVGMSATLREVNSDDLRIICNDLSTLFTPLSVGNPMRDWVDVVVTINEVIDLNEDQRKEIISSLSQIQTLYKTSFSQAGALLIDKVLSPLLKANEGDLSIIETIFGFLGLTDHTLDILSPLQKLDKAEIEQFINWLKTQGSIFAVQFSDIKGNSIEDNQMLVVSEVLYTALGASWSALDTSREQSEKFTRIANDISKNLKGAGYEKAAQAFSAATELPQTFKHKTSNLIESIIKHLEGKQFSVWGIFKRILKWVSWMLMHDPSLAKIRLSASITFGVFIISFIAAISSLASTAFIIAAVFLGITSLLLVTAIAAFIYKGIQAFLIARRAKKSVAKISTFLSNHLKDKGPREQVIALTALCDALFNNNANDRVRKMHTEMVDENADLYDKCHSEIQPVIDNLKKQKLPPRLLIGPLAGKMMALVPGGRKTPFELLKIVNNIFRSNGEQAPRPVGSDTLKIQREIRPEGSSIGSPGAIEEHNNTL